MPSFAQGYAKAVSTSVLWRLWLPPTSKYTFIFQTEDLYLQRPTAVKHRFLLSFFPTTAFAPTPGAAEQLALALALR